MHDLERRYSNLSTVNIAHSTIIGYMRVSQRAMGHLGTRNAIVAVPARPNVSVQNLGGFRADISPRSSS
jgi:hypothetical protein